MGNIALKQFRFNYNAELLTEASSSFKVGYEAEWITKWNFLDKNRFLKISERFFTDRIVANDQDDVAFYELLNRENQKPLENSHFANLDIDKSADFTFALNIPSLGIDLHSKVSSKRITKMTFSGIQCQVLSPEFNHRLFIFLKEIANSDNKKPWRQIKNLKYVEALYYASSVSISIETGYETELKATLELKEIKFSTETNIHGKNTTTITYENPNKTPFAAQIEELEDFMSVQ